MEQKDKAGMMFFESIKIVDTDTKKPLRTLLNTNSKKMVKNNVRTPNNGPTGDNSDN